MKIYAKAVQDQEKNHGEHARSNQGKHYPSLSVQGRTGIVGIIKGNQGKDQEGKLHQPFEGMIQFEIYRIYVIDSKPVEKRKCQDRNIAKY